MIDSNQPDLDRLTYTVAEAAQLLGISKTTAYECTKTGEIKSITLGRRIIIPRQAIRELLTETSSNARKDL